jgi:alanyl-tRNA synthetase
MKTSEVRNKFLHFYKKREHSIIPSASLVPENDQTTLFTGSGMQPMVPYLLGREHPLGARIVDSQRCFRAEDIDEIGDNRHTTFFEMLGNWSLGDYFKKEQLSWVFEFLTSSTEGLNLDPSRLYVTVFAGDEENELPRDEESAIIWQDLFKAKDIEAKTALMGSEEQGEARGMKAGERIFYYNAKKNWWSRAGVPGRMPEGEPGGPDSEIFYEFTEIEHNPDFGTHCHPNCDCGRFLEIGNSVFMQYIKSDKGFERLPKENVDFGGGLERLTAVSDDLSDVFLIDVFKEIVKTIESKTDKRYADDSFKKSFRIVADHMRGAVFMISDGITPSNTDQGYFVRRLIRRAVRHADILSVEKGSLKFLAETVAREYADSSPHLLDRLEMIQNTLEQEEAKFRLTLERGLKEFEKISEKNKKVSGEDAFILFSSYGFPVELTEELALERGLSVDRDGFFEAFKEHQKKSRLGAEKKFKGGLGDTSDISIRYHTATHLLNAGLRAVLGQHVEQKGSNITPDRMRFDFSHGEKLSDNEKKEVEEFVNNAIKQGFHVRHNEMSLDEARSLGAIGVFGDKYAERVTVYTIGDQENTVSIEICGGPHVDNVSKLGTFRILKEEASSSGVRRIKAILE